MNLKNKTILFIVFAISLASMVQASIFLKPLIFKQLSATYVKVSQNDQNNVKTNFGESLDNPKAKHEKLSKKLNRHGVGMVTIKNIKHIKGRVVIADNKPLVNTRVSLVPTRHFFSEDLSKRTMVWTDKDGTFSFKHLKQGAYYMFAEKNYYNISLKTHYQEKNPKDIIFKADPIRPVTFNIFLPDGTEAKHSNLHFKPVNRVGSDKLEDWSKAGDKKTLPGTILLNPGKWEVTAYNKNSFLYSEKISFEVPSSYVASKVKIQLENKPGVEVQIKYPIHSKENKAFDRLNLFIGKAQANEQNLKQKVVGINSMYPYQRVQTIYRKPIFGNKENKEGIYSFPNLKPGDYFIWLEGIGQKGKRIPVSVREGIEKVECVVGKLEEDDFITVYFNIPNKKSFDKTTFSSFMSIYDKRGGMSGSSCDISVLERNQGFVKIALGNKLKFLVKNQINELQKYSASSYQSKRKRNREIAKVAARIDVDLPGYGKRVINIIPGKYDYFIEHVKSSSMEIDLLGYDDKVHNKQFTVTLIPDEKGYASHKHIFPNSKGKVKFNKVFHGKYELKLHLKKRDNFYDELTTKHDKEFFKEMSFVEVVAKKNVEIHEKTENINIELPKFYKVIFRGVKEGSVIRIMNFPETIQQENFLPVSFKPNSKGIVEINYLRKGKYTFKNYFRKTRQIKSLTLNMDRNIEIPFELDDSDIQP